MPLHDQARELLDVLADLHPVTIGEAGVEEARRSPGLGDAEQELLRRRGETPDTDLGSVEDHTVPGPAGAVPVRVFRPSNAVPTPPVLVYAHGGGWVLGDHADGTIVRALADRSGCVVVSVGYRLAPEARFPASHDDVVAALRWTLEHGDELGADAARVVVGGDSAGATMATAACRTLALEGGPLPRAQLLLYPVTDLASGDGDHPSRRDAADTPPLTATALAWFAAQETTDDAQRRDPRLSPLRTAPEELAAMPPALVVTAEHDVLRDEGEAYARALMDARVHVTLSRFPGMMHGFLGCHRVLDGARLALTQAALFLEAAFEGAEPAAQ